MMPETPDVRVFPDQEALSQAAAEAVADIVTATAARQDRVTLALAGGSTPRRLYEILAEAYRDRLPWDRVVLFWGDERFVPHDHGASNYRMVEEALLCHLTLPYHHILPIPTTAASPQEAATAYETTLRRFFQDAHPTFDLTLLGLGTDGHTASLFPENLPLETDRLVEAVSAPARYEIRSRISLTLPTLNASRQVLFLAAGASKHTILNTILYDATTTLPAALVHAREHLTWLIDEAASLGRTDIQGEAIT